MSYHIWHDYGYGLCVDKIIAKWFLECEIEKPTIEDYLEYDQDYDCGIGTILRNVILEKEGIDLYCCTDFDSNRYLMYQLRYPWNMTRKDRRMTIKKIEKIEKIFNKFLRILTDEPFQLGEVESENGG